MALILTFLGKNGIACSKIAIAAAISLATQGKRVLLAGLADPTLSILLNTTLTPDPPGNLSQSGSSTVSSICTARTQLGRSKKIGGSISPYTNF